MFELKVIIYRWTPRKEQYLPGVCSLVKIIRWRRQWRVKERISWAKGWKLPRRDAKHVRILKESKRSEAESAHPYIGLHVCPSKLYSDPYAHVPPNLLFRYSTYSAVSLVASYFTDCIDAATTSFCFPFTFYFYSRVFSASNHSNFHPPYSIQNSFVPLEITSSKLFSLTRRIPSQIHNLFLKIIFFINRNHFFGTPIRAFCNNYKAIAKAVSCFSNEFLLRS